MSSRKDVLDHSRQKSTLCVSSLGCAELQRGSATWDYKLATPWPYVEPALHQVVLYTELCFTPSCAFHQVVLCLEFCLALSATEQIQEVEPARNKGRFTVCQRHIWISMRWARPLPVAAECPTQRTDSCIWTARRPDWGIVGERPIVLFKHQHTTLDKEIAKWCQWCHSHTVLVWQGFGQTSGLI